MNISINSYSKGSSKIITLLAALGLTVLLGCDHRGKADGTFLIVELENSEKVNQYSVFNPYAKTIEECNSLAKEAIEQILASVPRVVPKDSRVKSWRCSFTRPESGG
jgi:hypothetical protein